MAENKIQPNISPEMLKLIAEIDEFKGSWKAYKNLEPDRLLHLRQVATIESIASSTRIEGSVLSDKEVEKLLINIKIQKFKTRDEQEVAGYAELLQVVFESYDSIHLTENYLKQLHKILLQHSNKDSRHRGNYKTLSNSVEAFDANKKSLGIIFETSSPFDTPREMQELITWTNEAFTDKVLHPLLIISIFVVKFLAIHPFQDGNGRLSRVITTLLLLKHGYEYVPYVSMENIIEANKDAYYLALRRTQASLKNKKPEWEHWIVFFLRTLAKQKNKLLQKLERENLLLSSLPELTVQILDLAKEHGRIQLAEIIQITKAKRGTIKTHLANLVKSKQLIQHGKGRATWYTLAH
jgi:Fic family protein